MKSRVLNELFPVLDSTDLYHVKLVARYGDVDTQLAIVVYPGAKCELIRYSIAGISRGELSRRIDEWVTGNPGVTAREIAGKVKVETERRPVAYAVVEKLLKGLDAVRISPLLLSRTALDDASQYDFWYDTGQEAVHYRLYGPFNRADQDKLVQWMIRFRAEAADYMKNREDPK